MDGADFGVCVRRQESVEVVGGLAFLDLTHRRPIGPYAGEAGEGRLSSSANQMSPPSGPEERYSRANQTYVSNVLKTLPQHIQPEVWI